MTELELRKAICEVGRRLYVRNLVAATDGNVSVRMGPGRYLCTPSGVSKYDMAPNDIIIADGKANKISGAGKVTSEFFTHLAAYEERPDVNAVVHAHPPKALGFTLAGVSMADCVLPEVVYTIGGIPTAEYATPATPEGGAAIRKLVRECDAILMDRHGALTVGVNPFDALYKMEKIEHAAETLFVARCLGDVPRLSPDEVRKLYKVRERYGVSGYAYKCACNDPIEQARATEAHPELDRTVEETLRLLGRA